LAQDDLWVPKAWRRTAHRIGFVAVADELLLDEMDSMIKTGKAKSPNDAARLLADRASGSGTLVSKQTRLAIRYRKKFGPQKN
jgi:hypothetical protein